MKSSKYLKEVVDLLGGNKKEKIDKDYLGRKLDDIIFKLNKINEKPQKKMLEKDLAKEISHNIIFPNYPESVEVSNFDKINIPPVPETFVISNFSDIQFPKKMEVSNFPDIQQVDVINQQKFPEVIESNLDKYIKPNNPLAVRISDGKFFTELGEAIGNKISVSAMGGKKEIIPKDISYGIITTSSGSAICLSPSSLPCRTVSIQSHPNNSGYIYLGDKNVNPTNYGAILQHGEAKDIEIDNVSRIYISSDYNNEKVSFITVR